MKAVISVTGRDACGIIAKVSAVCAEKKVNILDISQTVLQDYFSMIMLVDVTEITEPFAAFVDRMTRLGTENRLAIHAMHEDIFNAMHRI
ncbi:MAG: ACT domain-containing protein [Lentisphaeria bacterium]|nr:ACT domain-containing protein [Lentisphaeria bacterium]